MFNWGLFDFSGGLKALDGKDLFNTWCPTVLRGITILDWVSVLTTTGKEKTRFIGKASNPLETSRPLRKRCCGWTEIWVFQLEDISRRQLYQGHQCTLVAQFQRLFPLMLHIQGCQRMNVYVSHLVIFRTAAYLGETGLGLTISFCT